MDTLNFDAKNILNELCRKWDKSIPAYVCFSRNFLIERILSKNNFKEIYGNDGTLYSGFMGNYLAGNNMSLKIIDSRYDWLEEFFKSEIDTIATLLLCDKYFNYADKKTPYHVRMAEAYRKNFAFLQSRTAENVRQATDGLILRGFSNCDVTDYIKNAPSECAAMAFLPAFKSYYEKSVSKFDKVFDWDKSDYKMLDDERFCDFIELVIQKKYWVISSDIEIYELNSNLIGKAKTIPTSKPIFIYSNTEIKPRFTMRRTEFNPVFAKRTFGEFKDDLKIVNYPTLGSLQLAYATTVCPITEVYSSIYKKSREYLAPFLPTPKGEGFSALLGDSLV